jgi:hypothetical protein
MKILVAFTIMLLSISITFSQTKKFKWTSDMCEFESTYDTSKYTLAQLRDTHKLMSERGLLLNFDATPQDINAVENLNISTLDREYLKKKSELENLRLVKSAHFENLRQSQLRTLEQVYKLSRITAEAYKKPKVLKQFDFAKSCVTKYADSLTSGGDALLQKWLEVNRIIRENNGDPDRIKRIYEEQLNSPAKFKYARNEVMTFGWWNCANAYIEYVDDNGQSEKEFKKLFKRTKKIGCDEP